MRETSLNFQNILVIDFGQLGDVVLSLPALGSIRDHFPDAKITLLLGKPGADIVRLANISDEQILVDRVALRDGNKLRSIARIFQLVKDVRRRKFDFVIDLHSLSETNILAFLSGAKWRLFARRENRSHDWLLRFPVRPPREDTTKHHVDRYFDVILPLGIERSGREFHLEPPPEYIADTRRFLEQHGIEDKTLIGLFLGAGHPTRRWKVESFVELARRLAADPRNQVLVFLGPEESDIRPGMDEKFAGSAIVVDELPLLSFFTMLSFLKVLVSGDTGPMHLGAIAGAGIVLISETGAPDIFLPLTDKLLVLKDKAISDLGVDEVERAALDLLKRA